MNKIIERLINFFENRVILQVLFLVAITLAATALRFYKLGEWSFWGDELIMVNKSLNLTGLGDLPSVSMLATKTILENWGITEWNARLAPTLIGIAAIPLLYFPIRTIFGPMVAIIAVLFLAVSPWHLYWSQNARFYTSLFLFYNLGLLLFFLGLEKNRLLTLSLALVALGLAFLERHVALFFGPILAGYMLFYNFGSREKSLKLHRRTIGFMLVPGLIAAVLFAPDFWERFIRFINAYDGLSNNSPLWIFAGSVFYIGIPVILFGVLGLYTLYTKKHRAFVLLGLSAFIPLLGTMALSPFIYTANRYVFVSLIAWIILASIGITELIKNSQGNLRLLALGSLLVVFAISMSDNLMYFMVQHGNRADWKSAMSYVVENMEPGDRVYSSSPEVVNYYLKERSVNIRRVKPNDYEEPDRRAWFIIDNIADSYHPKVSAWVINNTRLMGAYDVTVMARNFKMRLYFYDPVHPVNDMK
jgi:mannosyltransferase